MKFTYFISRLKEKYLFKVCNRDEYGYIKHIFTHYLIKRKGLTNNGSGVIFNLMTHHNDSHMPNEIIGKHFLTDQEGKNSSYFIPEENINTCSIKKKNCIYRTI